MQCAKSPLFYLSLSNTLHVVAISIWFLLICHSCSIAAKVLLLLVLFTYFYSILFYFYFIFSHCCTQHRVYLFVFFILYPQKMRMLIWLCAMHMYTVCIVSFKLYHLMRSENILWFQWTCMCVLGTFQSRMFIFQSYSFYIWKKKTVETKRNTHLLFLFFFMCVCVRYILTGGVIVLGRILFSWFIQYIACDICLCCNCHATAFQFKLMGKSI